MRIPSRFMPKYVPQPVSLAKKTVWLSVGLVLLAAAAYLFVMHPFIIMTVAAGILYFSNREVKKSRARRAALASSRSEGGLCEFARSFDCRVVDTWIVRAVFEELQEELGESRVFPLQATDRFVDDLHIDFEDLDLAHVPAIAARTGRSLDKCKANTYWGKVKSVDDLVQFFNSQPMQASKSVEANLWM